VLQSNAAAGQVRLTAAWAPRKSSGSGCGEVQLLEETTCMMEEGEGADIERARKRRGVALELTRGRGRGASGRS
jgi:hypothetical protein